MKRSSSTCTPWLRMIAVLTAMSPAVFDTSGERFSVQLTYNARRSDMSGGPSVVGRGSEVLIGRSSSWAACE